MEEILDFGILGGGFCGLLAGNELRKRGRSFLILEKEAEAGGLARTLKLEGAPWDTGPHAIYSANEEVLEFFKALPVKYRSHERKVRIVHHGADGKIYALRYPFENGIGDLPPRERADCLEGYVEARVKGRLRFSSLQDWIDNGLGYGMARHFMTPYNEKAWSVPPARISADLIRRKIGPEPMRTVIESAVGIPTIGRAVQAAFLYPDGGVGSIVKVLEKPVSSELMLGVPARRIRRERSFYRVETPRGSFRFRSLISTIPLKTFLPMQPFAGARKGGRFLAHNDTLFVNIVLKPGRRFAKFHDCHWLFFAGPEIFHRVTMAHAFHPLSPHHLSAELTWKKPVKTMAEPDIRGRVIRDLMGVGIIGDASDVMTAQSRLVPYTYPIPTIGLEGRLRRLERRFERAGIYLVGRSGRWDYLNLDQIVEKVWSLMGRIFPPRPA
ncbi:MAG TPA: FAD-dependent oxidoreductase [Elusimicrobiota bacterium]|nr:FAD-dependent oxidoreductase [Elusimicrobiota bacterium]